MIPRLTTIFITSFSLLILFSGCTTRYGRYVAGKSYLIQAEMDARSARRMARKVGYDFDYDIKPRYQSSCRLYTKAYYYEFRHFDLRKIEDALDVCMVAQDFEAGRLFLGFKERYGERRPYEAKHLEPKWMDPDHLKRPLLEPLPVTGGAYSAHTSSYQSLSKASQGASQAPYSRLSSRGTKPHIARRLQD